VTDIVHTRFVQMPDGVMRQSNHGVFHALGHLSRTSAQVITRAFCHIPCRILPSLHAFRS
jgi:hypothetical protein